MKRHVIKPHNFGIKKNQSPAEIRQEIDAKIQYIAQAVKNDPRKAAKIFETWLEKKQAEPKKRRAA